MVRLVEFAGNVLRVREDSSHASGEVLYAIIEVLRCSLCVYIVILVLVLRDDVHFRFLGEEYVELA